MMAYTIPSPLPINCTDCNQTMRIEYQAVDAVCDEVIVAAECACGRLIGGISGMAIMRHHRGAPLLRSNIVVRKNADLGKEAAEAIARAREHIADMERLIAAATWVRDGVSAPRGRLLA